MATATEDALLTALLHAAKFPSCAVGGALLGPAAKGATTATTTITAAVPLFHHPIAGMAACVEAGFAQVEALAASRGEAIVGYYHAPVHYAAPGPRAAAAGVEEAAGGGGEAATAATALPAAVKRIADRIAERLPSGSAPTVVLVISNPRLARFSGVIGGAGGGGGGSGGAAAAGAAAAAGTTDAAPCPFDVYSGSGWSRLPPSSLSLSAAEGAAGTAPASWPSLQRRWLNARASRLHRSLVDFDEHIDDVSRDYTNPGLLGEATRTLVR
jgi:hypothetical protein